MSTLRVGYLTKRRDACWWLRILNPMSYLNLAGHEAADEVFERQAVCHPCAAKFAQHQKQYVPEEYHYNHIGDAKCQHCGQVMMTGDTAEPMSAYFFDHWRVNLYALIEQKDLIGFQRPTDVSHLKLIKEAKQMGKKTFQICDDDYINVPDWNSGYRYYRDRQGTIQETLRIVDGLDVTTPYLVNLYSKFNKNIALIPNSLDMDLINVTPSLPEISVFAKDGHRLTMEQFEEKRAGKKFMLWGGSATHTLDLNLIVSAIRRIVRSENVCLGLVGYIHWPFLEVVPEDRLFIFTIIPCMQYYMTYKAMRADIGLAPVVECDFNRGKSPLKALEYQALGVLPVMSDFDTYQGCSPQGIYAKNDEFSWFTALRKAVHCDDLETRLQLNKEHVETHYNMKHNIFLWEKFYQSLS